MTLRMQVQTTAGGEFVDIDMPAFRMGKFKWGIGYSYPAWLTWEHVVPQHTYPLGIRSFVRFWEDDADDPDGNPFSESNPCFEGFIWDVEPVDSNIVRCTAYDSTQMSGRDTAIMSAPWITGSPPTDFIGAVPRLVYNVWDVNDNDYAFSVGQGLTIAGILEGLFNYAGASLRYYNAAPTLPATPYVAADLTPFVYVPQGKFIWESETFRSGLERLMTLVPDYKMLFRPGTRQWRFIDPAISTARTLTLNEPAASDLVLKLDLKRSLDGRYPAVKFYGPETNTVENFTGNWDTTFQEWTSTELQPVGASAVFLETFSMYSGGSYELYGYTRYQIHDLIPGSRRGAKQLPYEVLAPMPVLTYDPTNPGAVQLFYTRYPFVSVSFNGGENWASLTNVKFDYLNGVLDTGVPVCLIASGEARPGISTGHYLCPTNWRLTWAPFAEPLIVRAPATGYSGTSHSVANMTCEERIYSKDLAVGWDFGTPVTTDYRLEQYATLAASRLRWRKDIIYTGGATLAGLRYDYSRLDRRINLAAKNANGGTLTTGWEDVGAIVTDVEYDFQEKTTQLIFSSDQMELLGVPLDTLKQRLGINPLTKLVDSHLAGDIRFNGDSFIYMTRDVRFYDPLTGRLDQMRPA